MRAVSNDWSITNNHGLGSRGVFTSMFIVGPYNHKGGIEPRVSRPKTAIYEKQRPRQGKKVSITLWTRKIAFFGSVLSFVLSNGRVFGRSVHGA